MKSYQFEYRDTSSLITLSGVSGAFRSRCIEKVYWYFNRVFRYTFKIFFWDLEKKIKSFFLRKQELETRDESKLKICLDFLDIEIFMANNGVKSFWN